jgi:hypothetical protein
VPDADRPQPSTGGGASAVVDWWFRDRRTGRIVVAQFPNLALWIFLATVVLRWVVPEDSGAFTALRGVALAALAWWAIDEVVRGVNPWRRLLGLAGCAIVIVGLVT